MNKIILDFLFKHVYNVNYYQRQTDTQTDTHTDRQTDTQTDTHTHRHRDRQTDRHTHTDKQTDRLTDTHRHTQTDTYRDRQTHTQTNTHYTDTQTHIDTHLSVTFVCLGNSIFSFFFSCMRPIRLPVLGYLCTDTQTCLAHRFIVSKRNLYKNYLA